MTTIGTFFSPSCREVLVYSKIIPVHVFLRNDYDCHVRFFEILESIERNGVKDTFVRTGCELDSAAVVREFDCALLSVPLIENELLTHSMGSLL